MGLLDDAIREHLDLKRRRGGDPAEIEKAEQEALGPVRRDASATALSEMGPPAGLADSVAEDFDFVDADGAHDEHPTLLAGPDNSADGLGDAPGAVLPPDFEQPYLDDFTGTDPAPVDEFDLPGEGPIAAMPPEPEHKPKRRHLFHFRSHDHDTSDVFGDDSRGLPAELPDDDPFAEEPANAAPPVVPDLPAIDEAPRDTGGGEAVGRAQPIQRDRPESDFDDLPPAAGEVPVVPPPLPVSPPPAAERRQSPPSLQIGAEGEQGRTVEYDVEEAFAEEDLAGGAVGATGADDEFIEPTRPTGTEGEDILEETPDFLADTPDHDRLWFEQKPPPDFDFEN